MSSPARRRQRQGDTTPNCHLDHNTTTTTMMCHCSDCSSTKGKRETSDHGAAAVTTAAIVNDNETLSCRVAAASHHDNNHQHHHRYHLVPTHAALNPHKYTTSDSSLSPATAADDAKSGGTDGRSRCHHRRSPFHRSHYRPLAFSLLLLFLSLLAVSTLSSCGADASALPPSIRDISDERDDPSLLPALDTAAAEAGDNSTASLSEHGRESVESSDDARKPSKRSARRRTESDSNRPASTGTSTAGPLLVKSQKHGTGGKKARGGRKGRKRQRSKGRRRKGKKRKGSKKRKSKNKKKRRCKKIKNEKKRQRCRHKDKSKKSEGRTPKRQIEPDASANNRTASRRRPEIKTKGLFGDNESPNVYRLRHDEEVSNIPRYVLLYSSLGISWHLAVYDGGQVRGEATSNATLSSLIEVWSVKNGELALKAYRTKLFICVGNDGRLYGAVNYSEESCTFKEEIQENNQNTYKVVNCKWGRKNGGVKKEDSCYLNLTEHGAVRPVYEATDKYSRNTHWLPRSVIIEKRGGSKKKKLRRSVSDDRLRHQHKRRPRLTNLRIVKRADLTGVTTVNGEVVVVDEEDYDDEEVPLAVLDT